MGQRLFVASIACIFVLPALVRAAETSAAQNTVAIDANAEVAAVLFAASATQAAAAKSSDAKLRAQRARIQELAAGLESGDMRHRAEMTAAQDAFVKELAARDRDYSAQIAVFRGAVTDIAATPEGARALERFNAGDEAGALVILDRLRATNDQMRQARAKLEDAAEGRRIARLAMEARTRGKVTTQAAIERFEGVVKLDPGVSSDWLSLIELYRDAGQLQDARKAVDALTAAAHDDGERARASGERSEVLFQLGQVAESRAAAEDAVTISRRLAASDPADSQLAFGLARSLVSLGEVARRQADANTALKVYSEAVGISRRLMQVEPDVLLWRNKLASDLLHLSDALNQLGDIAASRVALEENLSILRPLAAQNPDNIVYPRRISVTLMWLADALTSLGLFKDSRAAIDEIIQIATRLSGADPANLILKRDLAYGLSKLGTVQRIDGDFAGSLATARLTRELFVEIARPADASLDARVDEGYSTTDISKMLYLMGDFAGAVEMSALSIARMRKLATTDSTDGTMYQYLAQALPPQGDALRSTGDFAGARRAYEEAIRIDRGLMAKGLENVYYQNDLAIGLLGLGQLEKAQRRNGAAVRALNESLAIRRKLARQQAGNSANERAIAETMREMIDLPGSKVTWAAFGEQLEAMQHNGLFWPADQAWLEEWRAHTGSAQKP
jgi:tetratricopeptide (TPR) repeat protein